MPSAYKQELSGIEHLACDDHVKVLVPVASLTGQEDAMPLTGVEGDYVAPAARDTYFQNEPNLIAPFDFDYVPGIALLCLPLCLLSTFAPLRENSLLVRFEVSSVLCDSCWSLFRWNHDFPTVLPLRT